MSTLKTKTTELSVAFGLLNREPDKIQEEELSTLMNGSLGIRIFREVKDEFYGTNKPLYTTLFALGELVRRKYRLFNNIDNLYWSGPERQASSVSLSQDLLVANISVSIKNESNVVYNLSPANLFDALPRGELSLTWSANWFLKHAEDEIRDLYEFASKHCEDLPADVYEFEEVARAARKKLQGTIKAQGDADRKRFNELYIKMCHKVAQISANSFNSQFSQTFKTGRRSALLDNIVMTFFRLDSLPYLLIGIDSSQPFAIEVPSITQWKQQRSIKNVYAKPGLERRQCVVYFNLECENKETHETESYKFHAEIRWSHGKFCGNPESKLYKDFCWQDVTFFANIV
jgi:hypothetical protein